MTIKTVRYGVIGVGNMGKNHVRVIHEMGQAALVGVADSNGALAAEMSRRFACRAYPDALTLIDECKPDAVSICVPTSLHRQIAIACMQRGVNVLLEKPIALTVRDGEEIIDCARSNCVKLMIGHIERFNPAVSKVKTIVESGEIGSVVSLMSRRVGVFPRQINDADIAVDLAIHDIDIVNYLLDGIPTNIVAAKNYTHTDSRADSVDIFLKYAKISAFIQANWITPIRIRTLNITGTDGYLEVDYINQNIALYKSSNGEKRNGFGETGNHVSYEFQQMAPDIVEYRVARKEPLKEELQYFLRVVSDPTLEIDSNHAIDALSIALKC